MRTERQIIICFRKISNRIRKTAEAGLAEKYPDLSEMNACILLFLRKKSYQKNHVFQKDLEKEFSISKATVSQIIARMEGKHLIQREENAEDSRRKRILLTEEAEKMLPFLKEADQIYESRILEGFSEQEKEKLLAYLFRVQENLSRIE